MQLGRPQGIDKVANPTPSGVDAAGRAMSEYG